MQTVLKPGAGLIDDRSTGPVAMAGEESGDAPTAVVEELAGLLLDAEDAPQAEASASVAQVFERVQELADENAELRRSQKAALRENLALSDANRELEWRVREAGSAASGSDTSAVRGEFEQLEAKLQLLLTENNMLEARSRQSAEEVRDAQMAAARLQAAQREATDAARLATEDAASTANALRDERASARQSAEAAREAEVAAATANSAIASLRNELQASRRESSNAHRELTRLRTELERAQSAAAASALAEARRRSEEKRARDEIELALHEARTDLQRAETAAEASRRAAESHAQEAARVKEAADSAQLEASEAIRTAQLASSSLAGRETELEQHVSDLSRKLELQAEVIARQGEAAKRSTERQAAEHAKTLEAAESRVRAEATLANERDALLHSECEALRVTIEREAREKAQLQTALDASVAALATAKEERAAAAAGGDVAGREALSLARSRAEDAELESERLRTECKNLRDEMARVRAAAERASGDVERSEMRSLRQVAQANAERDAMAVRLAQRGEAADAAIAEAAATEGRRAAEADAFRRHADAELQTMREQTDGLRIQLTDAVSAAAGLQELLSAQQRVAEAYREEAQRSLAKIGELEASAPLQRTLAMHREEEAQERKKLAAQLQRTFESTLEKQGNDELRSSLNELRGEIREVREKGEGRALAARVAMVVS